MKVLIGMMIYLKNNKKGQTAHNRTVYAASAVAGLVFRSLGHSAALHSHAHYRHIFAVAGNLRFPLSQPQKRHIQPERYMPLG